MSAESLDSQSELLLRQALEEQRNAIRAEVNPGEPVVVRACPGAGKTRVIVERHLTFPPPARRGRAIVSFTKVAGRELRRRCQEEGRPELAEFPNFIGTLDTFIWRHLVRPYLGPPVKEGAVWRRQEYWKQHPKAVREITKDNGERIVISLDDFDLTWDIKNDRFWVYSMKFDGEEEVKWAEDSYRNLIYEGYLSGKEIRECALKILGDEQLSPVLGAVLTSRFTELVIDEAQDCSRKDLEVLNRLYELGLPLLFVEDPAQAIYGFRERERGRESENSSRLGLARTINLSHNWRNSDIICRLASTLRAEECEPDVAVGEYRDEDTPIMLIPLERDGVSHVRAFCAEAEKLNIPEGERYVLGRLGKWLPRGLTGAANEPRSFIGQMIWAAEVLRAPRARERQRQRARDILRNNILDVWYGTDGQGPVEERCEKYGVAAESLARVEGLVLHNLPPLELSTREWKARACEVLGQHRPCREAVVPGGKPRWLRYRGNKDNKPARAHLEGVMVHDIESVAVGRATTIHQAKGGEADAVLVITSPIPRGRFPRDQVVDRWLSGRSLYGEHGEERNILYVAATRARRMLAFAMVEEQIRKTEDFLKDRGIPSLVVGRAPVSDPWG